VEALLAEQLRWLCAAALPSVRETVESALVKTEQRRAYELCDGSRSGPEVAKAVDVTQQSISNWSKNWRNLGIAYEVEGRKIKHLVTPAALELPLEVG
jgi:hypothetical protein